MKRIELSPLLLLAGLLLLGLGALARVPAAWYYAALVVRALLLGCLVVCAGIGAIELAGEGVSLWRWGRGR